MINDNLHQMIQAIYLHMFFDRKPNARLGDLLIEHPKSTVQVNDAKGFEGAYPFFTSGEAILRWNKPMTTDSICLLNTGGNADVKFYAGAAAYSTDTWCISATNGLTEYLYMLLQTIRKELDIKFFTGTGLKHLQKPLLKERPVYQPTSKEAARFNQIAVPAMALISENIRQNCELQTLRNWLLPMLMNGQATVEATQPNYRLSYCANAYQRNMRLSKTADPMKNGQLAGTATSQAADQGHVQICKRSRLRRFFQSSHSRIPFDLREHKAIKPLATIHFDKQVAKKSISRF